MPSQTYGQIFPVQTPAQTESLFAKDVLQGSYLVVQNNTAYDCNLLIFRDPTMAGKPNELTLRAGGSITYGGDLGAFAVYSVGSNNAATGVKPAGFAGGYVGAGAINQSGTIGYISVFAWDGAVPVDIPQSNFSQVSASLSGPLPAGTNNIGHVNVDSLPALPAGANNIGHVNVDALPALPAGANNIGHVNVDALPALPAGANNIGAVTPQMNGATSQTGTAAANTAVTLTIAGQAGKSIYIWGVKAGYTGGTATQVLTVQDSATTVENILVINALNDERSMPLKIAAGNSAVITLPAGGAAVTGFATARYEIR